MKTLVLYHGSKDSVKMKIRLCRSHTICPAELASEISGVRQFMAGLMAGARHGAQQRSRRGAGDEGPVRRS